MLLLSIILFFSYLSSTDIRDKPKTRIVLVQENYHSNDAITNIMYRYGVLNQLTFALPKKSTFQEYWPLRFHPSFVDNSLTFSSHVDMLVNPTHQHETLKRFMPKVMFIQCVVVIIGARLSFSYSLLKLWCQQLIQAD